MITERLMQAGSWGLTLKPETPKSVRDAIDYWGHVYVFDTPQKAGQSDATLIATSRWGGVVRTRLTPWQVGGANMIVWLGDENGKGNIFETTLTLVANTFTQYVTQVLVKTPSLTAGTVVAGGATKTLSYQWVTGRACMDHLVSVFGMEYRVNKDFTLDANTQATLFPTTTTPTAAAIRRSSGRDLNITGISVTQLDVATDVEDYITRAIVHDTTAAYTGSTGTAPPYRDGLGNLIVVKGIFEEPNTTAAEAAGHAATLVTANEVLHQQVAITTDEFDIDRDVKVGDSIWVYDEDGALKDTTNQIRYRGSFIYPLKVRVFAITWPIESGMSVWFRSSATAGNNVWTDLTNYVVWEAPGTTFEVGSPKRALTKS